jgi:hypothetical protein
MDERLFEQTPEDVAPAGGAPDGSGAPEAYYPDAVPPDDTTTLGPLKLQVTVDAQTHRDIMEMCDYFRVRPPEIVRTALRMFNWARREIAKGRDIGAEDDSHQFRVIDVPYTTPALGSAKLCVRRERTG